MTNPSAPKSMIVLREPAQHALKPWISEIQQWDRETRINPPFTFVFERLTYGGVVSRET